MTALEKKRLIARPSSDFEFREKDPPPKVRSAEDLFGCLVERKPLDWQEVTRGDRGMGIGQVVFRDLSMASSAVGAYLAADSSPVAFAAALMARQACRKAGAQYFNPRGTWTPIARRATSASAYFATEGSAPTESTGTLGRITPTPHFVGANIDYSRNLRDTSGGIVEGLLLDELSEALAVGIDQAALIGTGTGGQPTGIVNTADVGSVSGTALAWTGITEMLRLVEVANATPSAFVMGPATAKILRGRQRFTGVDTPILHNGKIGDVPAFVTTALTDTLICGDFRHLLIVAEDPQILANPYRQAKVGFVEIILMQFMDTAVLHPAAFAKSEVVT